LRQSQNEKENTVLNKAAEGLSLHEIISDIKEEYMSDLNPDDIPNSDISEIDEPDGDQGMIQNMEEG
jgi:5'-3' exonuclease